MNFAEKRKYERKLVQDVAIKLLLLAPRALYKFWDRTECKARDLSLFGVGICCQNELFAGERISIDLKVPENKDNIRVFGKVVWTTKENDKCRAGLSFSWWKDDLDKKIVDDLLKNRL